MGIFFRLFSPRVCTIALASLVKLPSARLSFSFPYAREHSLDQMLTVNKSIKGSLRSVGRTGGPEKVGWNDEVKFKGLSESFYGHFLTAALSLLMAFPATDAV